MILKHRYCIIEQIGEGGEGHLYLCRDLELGVLWAVKEIPRTSRNEAKLLRLFDHPALPKMIDYTERDEYCYLVMEYIRGKSLADWMKTGRRFSGEELWKMSLTAAGVLTYLHGLYPAVYYNDLKPENLMLTDQGDLYLVDFGAAVFAFDGSARAFRGTPGYAAPEQFRGEVSERTDLYGYGRTMLAAAEKTNKWDLLKQYRLLAILVRAACRSPKLRYQNMKEVYEKLSNCMPPQRRRKSGRWIIQGFFALLAALVLRLMSGSLPSYAEDAGQIMQACYESAFLNGTESERQDILRKTEQSLLKMLKKYGAGEEERRLHLMLALTEELLDEEEKAEMQYEQLLLFDPGYRIAYGEYGCFLLRNGGREAAARLWDTMEKKNREGSLEIGTSENLSFWTKATGNQPLIRMPERTGKSMEMGGFGLSVNVGSGDEWWEGESSSENVKQEENSWTSSGSADLGAEDTGSGEPYGETHTESGIFVEIHPDENTAADTSTTAGDALKPERVESTDEDRMPPAKPYYSNTPNQADTSTGSKENGNSENESAEVSDEQKPDQLTKSNAEMSSRDWLLKNAAPYVQIVQRTASALQTQEQSLRHIADHAEKALLEEWKKTAQEYEASGVHKKAAERKHTDKAVFQDQEEIDPKEKPTLTVGKYTLKGVGEKPLRFRILSDGAVHIWSMQSSGKECMWHYDPSGIYISCEENDVHEMELLLVYEEKIPEPILVLT